MKYIYEREVFNPEYKILKFPTVKFNHGDATIIIRHGELTFKTGEITNDGYNEVERENQKRWCFTCGFMPCFGMTFKIDPSTIDAKTLSVERTKCSNCKNHRHEIKTNDERVVFFDSWTDKVDKILPYFNNECKTKIVDTLIELDGFGWHKTGYETPLLKKLKYYKNFASYTQLPKYEHIELNFILNKNIPIINKNLDKIYKVQLSCHNGAPWSKFHTSNPSSTASFLYSATVFKKITGIYELLPFITNEVVFSFTVARIVNCYRHGNLYSIFDVYTDIETAHHNQHKYASRKNKNNKMKCEKEKSRYDFLKYYFSRATLTAEQNKEIWNLIVTLKAYKLIKELRDMNIIYPHDKFTFILTEMNESVVENTMNCNGDYILKI